MSNFFNERKGWVLKSTETKSTIQVGFYGYNSINNTKSLTSATTFSNYILIVYSYSKILKLYGKYKIATEEVMDKLDMFQSRYG